MTQTKKRLGLFALCAMAMLASTSLLASAAQAAPPAWMVNGADVEGATKIALKGNLVGESNLLSNVLKQMIRITCTTATPNASIEKEGKLSGTVNFTGCTTFFGGATNDVHTAPAASLPEAPACKPVEPIVAGGTGELALHEGKDLVKLTGTPFATLNLGAECAAGQEFEVKGSVFVEEVGGNEAFLKEEIKHKIREAVAATLALGKLTFGANPASIDGEASVFLEGEPKWNGLPL